VSASSPNGADKTSRPNATANNTASSFHVPNMQQQLTQQHQRQLHQQHLYLTQWPLVSPLFSQNNCKYFKIQDGFLLCGQIYSFCFAWHTTHVCSTVLTTVVCDRLFL
jgi:hypothetical protein